jgi:hypothetical protein
MSSSPSTRFDGSDIEGFSEDELFIRPPVPIFFMFLLKNLVFLKKKKKKGKILASLCGNESSGRACHARC